MLRVFSLLLIIGVLSSVILVVVVIPYLRPTPKAKVPIQQPTTEVLSVMQNSEEKIDEAKKLLSNIYSTDADQTKAKQLLQEALDDARKATELQPKSPAAWYYLGQIYKQLSDVNPKALPFAEDAIKKSLELDPDNTKVLQELGTIYILSKKYPEAEEVLQKSIQLDPKDANAFYKLGNVYQEVGEKEKARNEYLKAKKLTPENSKINHAMIDAQLKSLEE